MCEDIIIKWYGRTLHIRTYHKEYEEYEELDGPAVSAFGVRSRKLINVLNGQP
jgi:hypothetical protein